MDNSEQPGRNQPTVAAPVAEKNRLWKRIGALGGRTGFLLLVIVIAVVAAHRIDLRLDLTVDGRFSVQPELATLIENLADDVTVVGLFARSVDPTAPPITARQNELNETIEAQVQRLTELSPLLSYQFIDSEIDYQKSNNCSRKLAARQPKIRSM